jgi:hypothetical protein
VVGTQAPRQEQRGSVGGAQVRFACPLFWALPTHRTHYPWPYREPLENYPPPLPVREPLLPGATTIG